jgi:hypothetical protein
MKFQDIVGKTIARATVYKFKTYDDEPFLKLEFTDDSHCFVIADYGGYTGDSEDEYIRTISIQKDLHQDVIEKTGTGLLEEK